MRLFLNRCKFYCALPTCSQDVACGNHYLTFPQSVSETCISVWNTKLCVPAHRYNYELEPMNPSIMSPIIIMGSSVGNLQVEQTPQHGSQATPPALDVDGFRPSCTIWYSPTKPVSTMSKSIPSSGITLFTSFLGS